MILSILLIPVFSLFGQEKNDVSQLKWIKQIQTDAEKFYKNGTRISYLNIYGEIPEIYVQSIADQVKKNPSVLRFYLYYGKEFSRCMCEVKDDFTNEQLAVILDEIIDKYYDCGDYLNEKQIISQQSVLGMHNRENNFETENMSSRIIAESNLTTKAVPHCIPATGGCTFKYIKKFTTTGGITNINNSSNNSGANCYQNFSETSSMSATTGTTINYTIECTDGLFGRAIWIDWDNDGIFETSEKVASSSTGYSPLTGSFIVPPGTLSGPKRMRVLASFWISDPNDPCVLSSASGEYEDYKLIVVGDPCASATPMSCGKVYTTELIPDNGDWNNYTGVSNSYSGLEKVWSFTAPATSSYTFNVKEGETNADFFLMSSCSPSSTNLSNGFWSGAGEGTFHTVNLNAGVTYYLIADLHSSATSLTNVTVSVTCHACTPATISGSTHYISNFTTTEGITNINKSSGGSTNGYQNFYETDSVSANVGTTIGYSMTVAGGGSYGRAIWVDWNNNGEFEASEKIVSSTSVAASPLTGSIKIPAGTSLGPKRMRILATPASNPNSPCGNNDIGEYEDYKFIVLSDEIIGSGNCEDAVSFCASNQSSGYKFEITDDQIDAPIGQCHFLRNPSWWYMQVAEAGNIALKIASSCGDVDFACYGPFNNPTCDSTDLSANGTFLFYYDDTCVTYHKLTHPYDTTYLTTETPFCKVGTLAEPVGNLVDFGASISDVEYLQIFNANVGEYYVVIIGNYARCAGTVDFTQTNIGAPGAGSLDCGIVAPCNITSITATPTYNYGSTHSVSGNINFTNPPADGLLKICHGSNCQIFTPPFVSPQAYTLTGIPSDTLMNTLLAEFTSSTVNCARPVNYILQGNLPVELTSLSAYCKNNEVLLYWTTASEINNDYFEIQRSKNDIDWEVIAKVKGAGFSNTIKNYKYLDKECPNANFYYRLRQVDYDGKSQLSDIISIRCENIIEKTEVSIYPNPFNSKLNIEFKNWDSNVAEIELLDLTSRVIQKWNLQNTLSSFVHEVNLSNLNPSIYVIKIKTSDGVIIRKVEKR